MASLQGKQARPCVPAGAAQRGVDRVGAGGGADDEDVAGAGTTAAAVAAIATAGSITSIPVAAIHWYQHCLLLPPPLPLLLLLLRLRRLLGAAATRGVERRGAVEQRQQLADHPRLMLLGGVTPRAQRVQLQHAAGEAPVSQEDADEAGCGSEQWGGWEGCEPRETQRERDHPAIEVCQAIATVEPS